MKHEEIDPSVQRRVPIIFNCRDTCFSDKYVDVAVGGFTEIFEHMLNHPNILVELKVDALAQIVVDRVNKVFTYQREIVPIIYTEAIDELFRYENLL